MLNRFYILPLALISFLLVSCTSFIERRTTYQASNIFGQYKLLGTPKSSLGIGAKWNKELEGTIEKGLPEEDLVEVDSTGLLYKEENRHFSASLSASIGSFLGLHTKGALRSKESLEITGMVVVKVVDIDNLDITPSTSYLWEAIKVTSFNATLQSGRAVEAKAKIQKLSGDNKVEVSVDGGDLSKIKVSSTDLFIAVKTVSFEISPAIEKEDSLSNTNEIFRLYSVDFSPLSESEMRTSKIDEWEPPRKPDQFCTVKMVAKFLPTEKVKKWRLGCDGSQDGIRYELGRRITGNTVIRDQIIIESGVKAILRNGEVYFKKAWSRYLSNRTNVSLHQFVMTYKAD